MKIDLIKGNEKRQVEVEKGENLRQVLMRKAKGFLYEKPMNVIHCRGMGTCGTCAVEVTGEISPPTKIEKWRLNFPPHTDSLAKGMRLACQCEVLGDLEVRKLEGKWGQGTKT